jgi:hypothetical protein
MKTLKKSHLTWLLHVQLTLLTGYLHTHTHTHTNKQTKERIPKIQNNIIITTHVAVII